MNLNREYDGALCKSHSARSEKEFCRVCPSKLNKKELENVYFTLLENNLDLKTTVNSQREQIKILSTKVQRLTTLQKTYLGKEPKDCCGSKAVINEQKECISELRRSNQCLSERVRQLNMRLCSAKQFLKRSPFQSTSRCNRCTNKNASMSAMMAKSSNTNLRTTVASSQYLVKDIVSSRSANDDIVSQEKGVQYDFCDENKCRNHMEELQQKNEDLQQELSRLKADNTNTTSRLEQELSELRAESVRVRSERALADERSERAGARAAALVRKLATADQRCDELSVELAIEKRKVLELETLVRATDVSSRIASAVETHLANVKLVVPSPAFKPQAAVRTKIPHNVTVDEVFKNSDDSGYTEVNKSQEVDDTKASTHINQVLLEKIGVLQNQVNILKASNKDYYKSRDSLNITQETEVDNTETYKTLTDVQKMDENIISESSDSVVTLITEKKSNNAKEVSKNDECGKIESKNQAIDQLNRSNKINPEYDISFKDMSGDKVEKQQTDFKADNKRRESFKCLRRRSRDVNESNREFDGRKLSLESLRETLKERNIIKTGSLDENKINIYNVDKDSKKVFEETEMISESSNITRISQLNNDVIANKTDIIIKLNDKFKRDSPVKSEVNNPHDKITKNANDNVTKEDNKKDSDSSKGTYTIHKDENVLKVETKPNNDYGKGNEINKKHLSENTSHKRDENPNMSDIEHVLNGTTKNTSKKSVHRRRCSTPSEPRTYVKAPRDVSPDSTDNEISSMSDLPSERDERNIWSRSPGEEKPTTTTDSRAGTTTTDYGSLSEGELPYLRDTTVLSAGEMRPSNTTATSYSGPVSCSRRMEDTLAAVEQELARCTDLLRNHAHRSLDVDRPK